MSKSIIRDITPAPWNDEIFNSIEQSEADIIIATHSPEMVNALYKIADPWTMRRELLFADDASIIFEMAGIARKILQKLQDEYDKNSDY